MKGLKRTSVLGILLVILMLLQVVMVIPASATDADFTDVLMNVGSDETERNLSWYSKSKGAAEVRYGKSTDGTLPANYMSAKAVAVQSHKEGYYVYQATMTALEENTSYVYTLVVGESKSSPYSFKVGSFGDSFTFAFIADAQVGSASGGRAWTDSLVKIKKNFSDVSFIVSGGDQTSDPARESHFGYFISSELSTLAVSTTVGPPHDNTVRFREHYNLPNLSTKYGVTTTSADYFYKYNNVLFMHLNVENSSYENHVKFMEQAIEENPDCAWRIVVLHYSFFTGGKHSSDGAVQNFRSNLAGEFNRLDVDAVLSGHDHIYARSQLMLNGNTVSSDVVTNNSVTDPEGTLYLCGTSASGTDFDVITQNDDDAYIAYRDDSDRKGAVIFEVNAGTLSFKSYFLDGNTPELMDSFTIHKTPAPVRLNADSGFLEVTEDGGEHYLPLVDAYAYSNAIVRVVNGSYALSTDGGDTYQSLNIRSQNVNFVLHLNATSGEWEYSENGGESYVSTDVYTNFYTVKYVFDPDQTFTDPLTAYTARSFSTETPDAPPLLMPLGSLSEGVIYKWRWAYYALGGNGEEVTTFRAGEDYVAYPVAAENLIASTIYVATASAPSEYTYTWDEAWGIVSTFSQESFTLVLKENINLTSYCSLRTPTSVTLDLAGNTLNCSSPSYAVAFGVGSSGSVFNLVSSESGGTIYAGSKSVFYLSSNGRSVITINVGSESTEPLQLTSAKYLVAGSTNFKIGSTLNLNVYGGSYSVSGGLVDLYNISATTTKNIFKIRLENANVNLTKASAALVKQHKEGFLASESSTLDAIGCVFTDTSTSDSSSSTPLISGDYWLGTMSFTDCDFIGTSIGTTSEGTGLSQCQSITINEGCSFQNSDKSFAADGSMSFRSEKVEIGDDCVLARADGEGTICVVKENEAALITWYGPTGYSEYWKKGVIPVFCGETRLVSGENEYDLVFDATPTAATGDTTYHMTTAQGYLFRFEQQKWQVSVNGGKTYQDLDAEIREVACIVTIDGEVTKYPAGTSFDVILKALNVSANNGKVITVTLGEDMTQSAAYKFNGVSSYTLNIDLAGHRLILNCDGKIQFGGAYDITIYSSAAGGELVYTGASDCIQIDRGGSFTFGSEQYKDMLTVTALGYLLNTSSLSNGSTVHLRYLYSTFNVGSYGLLRLNAKGSAVVTLEAQMKGITVNCSGSVIYYNASSSLGASSNGGVYSTASVIEAKDSSFIAPSDSTKAFFSHKNFTDRYFGKVNFEGCTFSGVYINGELIYSDSSLSYNTYFDTLTDYDPTQAITVGEGCRFYNSAQSFNAAQDAFASSNTSVADGYQLTKTEDGIVITKQESPVTTGFVKTYLNLASDLNMIFRVRLPEDADATVTFRIGEYEVSTTAFAVDENGLYLFKLAGITPAKMNESITATLIVNGEVVDAHECTIKQYLDAVCAMEGVDAQTLALVDALLVYGVAAQQYVNGSTAGFDAETVEALATLGAIEKSAITYEKTGTGIEQFAMNLGGSFYLRAGIVVDDATGMTLEVGDKAYSIANYAPDENGIRPIVLDSFTATELDQSITLTLKQNGEVIDTLTLNANAYLYMASQNNEDSLATLAKAIYAYGVAAEAYASKN